MALSEYAHCAVEGAATPPPLPRRRYPAAGTQPPLPSRRYPAAPANPHWQNATALYTKAKTEVSELYKLAQKERNEKEATRLAEVAEEERNIKDYEERTPRMIALMESL